MKTESKRFYVVQSLLIILLNINAVSRQLTTALVQVDANNCSSVGRCARVKKSLSRFMSSIGSYQFKQNMSFLQFDNIEKW